MTKKILYVHHGAINGGAAIALLNILDAIDRTVYNPVVCCTDTRADEVSKFFANKGYATTVCALRPFSHTTGGGYSLLNPLSLWELLGWCIDYPSALARFTKVIAQENPDLVHLNSLVLAPYAQVAAKKQIPVLLHEREAVLPGVLGIRTAWLRWHINRYVAAVLFICEDYARRLQVRNAITNLLYDGIDFIRFSPSLTMQTARVALGIPEDAKVVLFAGGAKAINKGRDIFLAAMGPILQQNDNLIVLLPSFSWPIFPIERKQSLIKMLARVLGYYRRIEAPVAQLIKSGKLEKCLHFFPFREDIENFIAASDVVCIPHILPHCSLTLIQAWGAQRAVVVSKIGGLEEFVKDAENALVVKPGDAVQLAEAVTRLLSDTELNNKISKGGFEYAVKTFDIPQLVLKLESLYRTLLNEETDMSAKS